MKSPCNGKCVLHHGACTGCLRTAEQVHDWRFYSDDYREKWIAAMNKSKEQTSTRRPETIELWLELTGKKLFWWEPLGNSGSFVVCDTDATEYVVRQNKGDVEFRQISK